MASVNIYFVRHTSVNVPLGTCYGHTDVPLSDTFIVEAQKVKHKLCDVKSAVFYSSPSTRCLRLAEFCNLGNINTDSRIMEMNFGQWEMKKYDEITDPHLQVWYDDYINTPATDGESFIQQYVRVSTFIDDIKQKHNEDVLVFTHGGVIACASIYFGLTTFENAFSNKVPYGGVMKFQLL